MKVRGVQKRRDVDPQTYSRVNGFLKRHKDESIEEKIVFSINGMGTIGCPYAKDKNLKKKNSRQRSCTIHKNESKMEHRFKRKMQHYITSR